MPLTQRAILAVDLCGYSATVRADATRARWRVMMLVDATRAHAQAAGGEFAQCAGDETVSLFRTVEQARKAAEGILAAAGGADPQMDWGDIKCVIHWGRVHWDGLNLHATPDLLDALRLVSHEHKSEAECRREREDPDMCGPGEIRLTAAADEQR